MIILLLFLFLLSGCGSQGPHLKLELDPALEHLPHGDLTRRLDIEFRPASSHAKEAAPETPQDLPRELPLMIPVAHGVLSGGSYELTTPASWGEDQAGVWRIKALGEDGRTLLAGETQTAAGERDVTVLLRESL